MQTEDFTIPAISFLNDVSKLPKIDLEAICADLDISPVGSAEELTNNIWNKLEKNQEKKISILDGYRQKLLSGRTSVSWFKVTSGATLKGAKQKIIEKAKFNPFQVAQIPSPETLTSTPVLVNASQGFSEDEYFLRFMFKTGNARNFYADKVTTTPKNKIVTVFVDEKNGFVEIRTDFHTVGKVAIALGRLIEQEINLEKVNIAKKFGNKVEAIAQALSGNVVGASSKPLEQCSEELAEEESKVLVSILQIVDAFLSSEIEADVFSEKMVEIRDNNIDLLEGTKFIALILSGLGKVGLDASKHTLKDSPLYEMLKPFVINQEGNISFSVIEEGISNEYLIRVGFTTNSVVFVTASTEKTIKFVRDVLLN